MSRREETIKNLIEDFNKITYDINRAEYYSKMFDSVSIKNLDNYLDESINFNSSNIFVVNKTIFEILSPFLIKTFKESPEKLIVLSIFFPKGLIQFIFGVDKVYSLLFLKGKNLKVFKENKTAALDLLKKYVENPPKTDGSIFLDVDFTTGKFSSQ